MTKGALTGGGMADAEVSASSQPMAPEVAAPTADTTEAAVARRPDQDAGQSFRRNARRLFWPGGLSSRLLILTILFVALAGLLILPSSMAQFEERWLEDRVRAAELASLAVEASPTQVVSNKLSNQLLDGAGVVSVAVQSDGVRRLMLQGPRMNRTPYLVDLRRGPGLASLTAPFETLFGGGRMVRVVARPRFRSGDFVEIVASDTPLRHELQAYLLRLLAIAAIISAVAGGMVYLSLNALFVRPMQRITKAMERFRADPEDPAASLPLSGRRDEIGRAEAELDRMQADLRAALNSRARLAALGEAVAKINHDLRNMLTSAQIASGRLAQSGDPKVAQALPRLERALDRAVTLASNVLTYGKSEEAAPRPDLVLLAPAVEAAAEDAGLTPEGVALTLVVDRRARVLADPEQLHRIMVNLLRNGRQAITGQAAEGAPPAAGTIQVSLEQDGEVSVIRIADSGPGVPERVRARLFQPFAGSGRPDGAGLGLAISRELAQGHGGDLTLARSGPDGAVFELRLPGAPEPTAGRRK
jgi:signal transduction histidine kinase